MIGLCFKRSRHCESTSISHQAVNLNGFLKKGKDFGGWKKKGEMLRRRAIDKDEEHGTQGSFHGCA